MPEKGKFMGLPNSGARRTGKMIPIFIISSDRLKALKESIKSYYDCIKTPFKIIVIDFGTSYEPTLEYLEHLEDKEIKVYWNEKISYKGSLNLIDEVIQDYFEGHPASNYVVTDPDIVLDNVDGDVLEVYAYLLKRLHKITVVGPMLRIDDIPDCYPLKEKVISRSLESCYHLKKTLTIPYEDKDIKYKIAFIDTTFGMRRAGENFWRHRWGVRVLSPYGARHLEWYIDPKNLTEDQKYYITHASRRIATWTNVLRRDVRMNI
jgi:hypothetical protein